MFNSATHLVQFSSLLYDCDIYKSCRSVSGVKNSKRDNSDTEDIDIEYRNSNNSDESHESNSVILY